MELRQLRYFATVAEELHFGRAAERLAIVQSAVSQQVRRLERELGVELFDRSPRHVRLTEAGTRFLPAAQQVLSAERAALATVAEFVTVRGLTLRVGTSSGLGDRLVAVLNEFARVAPDARIELAAGRTRERMEQVLSGDLDATFVRGLEEPPDDALRLVPVWQDRLVAALSAKHPQAGGVEVDIKDLADLPLALVARADNPPLVDLVVGACRDAGFEPVPGATPHGSQDMFASFGAGIPGWTVMYEAHARQFAMASVGFPLLRVTPAGGDGTSEALCVTTSLVVRADAARDRLRPLLEACRAAGRDAERT